MSEKKKELEFDSLAAAFEISEIANWKEAGEPFIWCTVEEKNGYTAQIDIGYGNIRLKKGKEELARGKHFAAHEDVVVLDTEYYFVKKYLWF